MLKRLRLFLFQALFSTKSYDSRKSQSSDLLNFFSKLFDFSKKYSLNYEVFGINQKNRLSYVFPYKWINPFFLNKKIMSLGKVIIVAFDHFKKLLTCRKLTSQMLKFMLNKNKETSDKVHDLNKIHFAFVIVFEQKIEKLEPNFEVIEHRNSGSPTSNGLN